MRARWSTVAVVVLALLAAAGGVLVWRSKQSVDPGVTVVATGTVGTAVDGSQELSVTGDTKLRIGVSRLAGGSLHVVTGPSSSLPDAIQFPSYRATGVYPRAVLSLTPTSGGSLTPTTDFSYGAVLRLDAAGSTGRPEDNGDNVFQRGLSSEKDLFKLEMDHDRPACTMRGSTGTVIVRATKVTRQAWYSVTCSRVGDKLTVSATPYGSNPPVGALTPTSNTVSGSIGTVSFVAGRPASVGGKLLTTGAIYRSASDQFNGAIAKVWTRPLSRGR